MKKFLSLLLALVMTMSLVTISAGATEYKDLTDKDELGPQYQEAVAVLNKIGVITGYDDGSFRPDVELTRGAAAKIIVSLLIGPEAANNLANSTAPYPDVPVSHTFAGVISYCKNTKIIDGYGDGTFRPGDPLSGYAFAKMLLSALGYDNNIEGFVGAGWTNNVVKIGQEASLFDRLEFKGSETVSRKDAALLALNTLKATVVEYKNGQTITVTGDNVNVVASTAPTYEYKTSNQDYARNILPQRRDINNSYTSRADYNTVEFAEEHFIDLRLPHDKYDPIDDDYGRPSAEWTYKKLSIGKFPLVPDAEYTAQVAHDVETVTDAAKVRALELSGYTVSRDTIPAESSGDYVTRLWINGVLVNGEDANGKTLKALNTVGEIADYTDNGTLVEVYVDNNGADFITDVVVIKSQLMEIKRVGADYVTLEATSPKGETKHAVDGGDQDVVYGFNQEPVKLTINNVEVGDDYYDLLSGLKAGDRVVVEPVAVDHGKTDWEVGHAYVPETVKGTLNGVPDRFGTVGKDYSSLSVDVGGTTYKVSLWNKDLSNITPDMIKVTKKDVTLTLDRYGYALLGEDVGSMDGWLIVGNYRQSIENGILVTYANGWDLDGNEVSLNIGARAGVTNWTGNVAGDDVWVQEGLPRIGSLVKYSSSTTSNTADWDLSQANEKGVYNIYQGEDNNGDPYCLLANGSTVTVTNAATTNVRGEHLAVCPDGNVAVKAATETVLMGNSMKYIYVSFDDSGELDSIEITTNRTKVENDELNVTPASGTVAYGHLYAQAAVETKVDANGIEESIGVKAVIIKRENSDASYKNLLYVVSYDGSAMRDADGQMVQGYQVAMMDENGKVTLTTVYAYRTSLVPGNFARYTKSTHVDHPDDFYTLRAYDGDPGRSAATLAASLLDFKDGNKNLWTLYNIKSETATTRANNPFMIESTYANDRSVFATSQTENWDKFANSMVNLRGAAWVDLTKHGIDSVDDLKDVFYDKDGVVRGENRIDVTLLFNDETSSDYFRNVYLIIITSVVEHEGAKTIPPAGNTPGVTPPPSEAADWYTTPDTTGTLKGVTTTFSIDADVWAAEGSTTTMTTQIVPVIDGVTETSEAQTVTLTRDGDKMVGTARFLSGLDLTGATISFTENKSEREYSAVKVRYFDEDKTSIDNNVRLTNKTTEVSSAAAGTQLKFDWVTMDTTNTLKVDVTGVTPSFSQATTPTGSDGKISYATSSNANIVATGKSYVDVTITGTGSLSPDTYDININGIHHYVTGTAGNGPVGMKLVDVIDDEDFTDADAYLYVASNLYSVAEGSSVTYDFSLRDLNDPMAWAYKISWKLNGVEDYEIVDMGGDVNKTFSRTITGVTEDQDLTDIKVEITGKVTFYAESAVVSSDKKSLVITFTDTLDGTYLDMDNLRADNDGTSNKPQPIGGSMSGKVLTLNFANVLVTSDVVKVDAAVKNTAGALNKSCTITISTDSDPSNTSGLKTAIAIG